MSDEDTQSEGAPDAQKTVLSGAPSSQDATLPVLHVPSPKERFFDELHNRLMMAHAVVPIKFLRMEGNSKGVLILTHKDLAYVRFAAGALIYAQDGRTWNYVGDGFYGADASEFCAIVSVEPYPEV